MILTTDNKHSSQGVPSQPTDPLDKIAKSIRQSTAKEIAPERAQERRRLRYKHQKSASELLPGSRTSNCLWAVSSNTYGVDAIHNTAEHRARFSGLQTCGSVWACPCCSGAISEVRRLELNTLLQWARKEKLFPVLMTLTARHTKDHDLKQLLDGMKNARGRLLRHRTYSKMSHQIVGSVVATEVTGGGFNGWHPHFHVVMLLKVTNEKEAIRLIESLSPAWFASLKAENLDGNGNGFDVQNADQVGNYIAKWGAAEELALNNKKKGRSGSKTPFELLADYSDNANEYSGKLFKEYANVFKGRRQLTWSRGLKKLANISEVIDEKIAEDQARLADISNNDILVEHYTPREWKTARQKRAEILTDIENYFLANGGIGGVAPDGDTSHSIQALIYTDETDARSSVPSCHDKHDPSHPDSYTNLSDARCEKMRGELGKDIDFC